MAENKKYYWLKLKRDFFKRHDMRIIEELENGKDYLLFYLKLLVESIDHEGELRFSDTIPYNEKMLSTITNTNIDIVRSAVKVLSELDLIEKLDDGTIFMNQVQTMIGAETEWADKKRLWREQKQLADKTEEGQKKTMSDKSIEKELELDKDIIREAKKTFIPPKIEQVQAYIKKLKYNDFNAEQFIAFYDANGWVQGKGKKIVSWEAAVRYWNSNKTFDKKSKVVNNKVCPICGTYTDENNKCPRCDDV